MNIKKIINLLIFFSAGLFFIELAHTGGNHVFDLSSLFFIYLILGSLAFINNFFHGPSKPLIIILIVLIFMWIIIRLHVIVISPENFHFTNIIKISSSSFNYSLLLITLCIISLSSGIKFGEIANNNNRKIIVPFRFLGGEKNLLKILTILYLIAIILAYVAKFVHASGRGGGSPFILAIFTRFLPRDFLFFLITVFCVHNWRRFNIKNKATYYIIFSIQVLILLFVTTSKGAIFWSLFYLFVAILSSSSRPSKYEFSKSALMLSIPIILLSLFLYNFGNSLRHVQSNSLVGQNISYKAIWENRVKLEQFSFGEGIFNEKLLVSVSKGLSQYDYLFVMFNKKAIKDEYFGGLYLVKNVANMILPGLIFPDVIHTARLFRVAYGQQTFSNAFKYYHTDMIPIFGQTYMMGGIVLFLPLLFFIGTIFSMIYCFYTIDKDLYLQRAICIYLFYTLLFTMGFDTFIGEVIFFILFPIIAIRIFRKFIPDLPNFRLLRT